METILREFENTYSFHAQVIKGNKKNIIIPTTIILGIQISLFLLFHEIMKITWMFFVLCTFLTILIIGISNIFLRKAMTNRFKIKYKILDWYYNNELKEKVLSNQINWIKQRITGKKMKLLKEQILNNLEKSNSLFPTIPVLLISIFSLATNYFFSNIFEMYKSDFEKTFNLYLMIIIILITILGYYIAFKGLFEILNQNILNRRYYLKRDLLRIIENYELEHAD